ncbi:MAG: putative Ig domain-containing protein [Anaerolineae bacterium]
MEQGYSFGGERPCCHPLSGVVPLLVVFVLLTSLSGCGRGNNDDTVEPPDIPPPSLTISTLPDGVLGISYTATLSTTSLAPPLTWSVTSGGLPDGLSLDSDTGEISGTPTTVGTFVFTIQVTDSQGQSDSQEFTVAIGDPSDPQVVLVSLANDGSLGNSDSGTPALSGDGRFVAFTSFADNLVPNDTNGFTDIFLRDRTCGTTTRVSVADDGTEADSRSFSPALSAPGIGSVSSNPLFVAYVSEAANLVASDTNNVRDVFVTVVDISSCPPTPLSTVRVSVASDGTEADGNSQLPSISANGLFVAYHSGATNLAEADNNDVSDAFLTELDFSGGVLSVVRTRRASLFQSRVAVGVPNTTAEAPFGDTTIGNSSLTLTDDEHIGREVEIVEGTGAGQLRLITDNDTTTLTVDPAWETLPDDTSIFRVVAREEFTADIVSDTTIGNSTLTMTEDEHINRLAEVISGPGAGQARLITANDATTLTVDPAWNTLPDASSKFRVLRQGDSASLRARISADGAFVAFDTTSTLEEEDTNNVSDVFVYERATGLTTRVSLDSAGGLAGGSSFVGDHKANGRLVVFQSLANDLVEALPSTAADIFSETTIGNSGLALTPDAHVDQRAEITSGTGAGQGRTITANTETTLTVDPAWNPIPDGTSVFRILSDNNNATDLFVHDRDADQDGILDEPGGIATLRVSVASDGTEANGGSDVAARLSGGGHLVVFTSLASNLVDGDRNATRDVFLRDRQTSETRRLSLGLGGTNPGNESTDPAISLDGTTIAFASTATNLVANDDNDARDVFLMITSISDPPLLLQRAPIIVSSQLPRARQGAVYDAAARAAGGTPPLFWTVGKGALPPGLFLDSRTGSITGIPQQAGRYRFTLVVMDAGRPARLARKPMTLVVDR